MHMVDDAQDVLENELKSPLMTSPVAQKRFLSFRCVSHGRKYANALGISM